MYPSHPACLSIYHYTHSLTLSLYLYICVTSYQSIYISICLYICVCLKSEVQTTALASYSFVVHMYLMHSTSCYCLHLITDIALCDNCSISGVEYDKLKKIIRTIKTRLYVSHNNSNAWWIRYENCNSRYPIYSFLSRALCHCLYISSISLIFMRLFSHIICMGYILITILVQLG